MIQAIHKLVTFEDFAAWRPEGGRYELHDGVIVEIAQPVGDHEDVVGFLALNISIEIGRQKLPYFIPKTVLVKPFEGESAYSPDILIINRPNLVNEPFWKKESTVSQATSIPLVIEVVSTNWRDDYYKKLADYEAIGIPEYWIIDYAAIGARKFIGNPKLPTISIYELIDSEYQVTQFKGDTHIVSPTFPELNLTAEQIFQAGGVQI
ncbi:MAG: Uma2 family endonuclease [Nostoc sp. DedQUE08]|uniref:Uma2 family endonuclease n=1 Tax=unclassified Nostoc TaxID=2593658 RepID=UPI002AD49501|nr:MULTISPECIES: Uma2 family endonuclease [unclassified Nostoc]MDZ8064115.1 Uma2 family endonuclease [Nostoc sp. DedQUE08]MDZ8090813.1 Uma2 family endonuclease [Nostoc sp. DedQUE05]